MVLGEISRGKLRLEKLWRKISGKKLSEKAFKENLQEEISRENFQRKMVRKKFPAKKKILEKISRGKFPGKYF